MSVGLYVYFVGFFWVCLCSFFLQYFDTVGRVFWPVKTVSHITYTVLAGTLNTAQSINHVPFVFCFKLSCERTTAVQAWQPCPLREPSHRHPMLLQTRGFAVFCVYCLIIVCLICLCTIPSVLWYCWLGLLTCKIRLQNNLYCVGGDAKNTAQSNPIKLSSICPSPRPFSPVGSGHPLPTPTSLGAHGASNLALSRPNLFPQIRSLQPWVSGTRS